MKCLTLNSASAEERLLIVLKRLRFRKRRPKNAKVDRQLRRLIADANQSGDCIISGSTGYYRPGDDDSVEAEIYFASERHRARAIMRKVRKMEEVYNRRYQ